jgi:hypothetical protein
MGVSAPDQQGLTPLALMFARSIDSTGLGFFGRAQMTLGLALDAILGLVVVSRRHEPCDLVHAGSAAPAGMVVHNLADIELVTLNVPSTRDKSPRRGRSDVAAPEAWYMKLANVRSLALPLIA